MPQILFICTGNICRSPVAEVLLKHRLEREGLTDWQVISAGTWTAGGHPASRYSAQLMAERGLDLTQHLSQSVDRRLIEASDLVLGMTHSHIEALRLEFPDQADKMFLLSEMNDGHRYDIEDPYGGSLADYQNCVKELNALIDVGLGRIVTLVEKNGN